MKTLGRSIFFLVAPLVLAAGTSSPLWTNRGPATYPHPTHAQSALDWVQVSTVTSPSARFGHAMAYDATRDKIVLFGGEDDSTLLNDTWEYSGNSWAQVGTVHSPTPRRGHRMVYDSSRGRVVLFGGYLGEYLESGETWEYDGQDWVQISTATSPFSRASHAMAYDSSRSRVVLQGGQNLQGPGTVFVFSGTWEYDGVDWTQITSGDPGNFASHDMTYDDARHKTILAHKTFIGTWEWDGVSWTEISTPSSPARRSHLALEFDRMRSRVVLFGGGTVPDVFNDTWEFDGADWMELVTESSPPARTVHDMACDTRRNRIVLFGGRGGSSDEFLSDTWELMRPLSEHVYLPSIVRNAAAE